MNRTGAVAASVAVVQVLYTVRSERMLMEQLEYNLLLRWFVGLTWMTKYGATSISKNRDRLLGGDIGKIFSSRMLSCADSTSCRTSISG